MARAKLHCGLVQDMAWQSLVKVIQSQPDTSDNPDYDYDDSDDSCDEQLFLDDREGSKDTCLSCFDFVTDTHELLPCSGVPMSFALNVPFKFSNLHPLVILVV